MLSLENNTKHQEVFPLKQESMSNANPYFDKDNKNLSQDALQTKLRDRLNTISDSNYCRNFDQPDYRTRCICLHQFSSEVSEENHEVRNKLVHLMTQYAGHNEEARQLVLHGIITNGFVWKSQSKQGARFGSHYLLPGISDVGGDGNLLVCANAIR